MVFCSFLKETAGQKKLLPAFMELEMLIEAMRKSFDVRRPVAMCLPSLGVVPWQVSHGEITGGRSSVLVSSLSWQSWCLFASGGHVPMSQAELSQRQDEDKSEWMLFALTCDLEFIV